MPSASAWRIHNAQIITKQRRAVSQLVVHWQSEKLVYATILLVRFLLKFISKMSWFSGFQVPWAQQARPQLSRRTSQKVDSFLSGERRSGSLVLGENDLALLKTQTKLEKLKRKAKNQKMRFQEEKDTLKATKQKLTSDLQQKLKEMLDDKDYERIIRLQFEFAGVQGTTDLKQEVQLLRKMHQAMVYQTLSKIISEQCNDDIMEFYGKTPQIKEKMSEREATSLSNLCQYDAVKNDIKQLHEHRVELYGKIIETYKDAEKDRKKSLVIEEEEEESGELKVRAPKQTRSHDIHGQHHHLETLNQPKNAREDEKSLGDEDLFDPPEAPPPKKPLLTAAKKAREQRDAEVKKRMEARRLLLEKEGVGSNDDEKHESRAEAAKKRLESRRRERAAGESSSTAAATRATRERPERSPVRSITGTARNPVRTTTDRRTTRTKPSTQP